MKTVNKDAQIEKLKKLLESLGKTAAEVAASLKRRRIKGRRQCENSCPIAKLLEKKTGAEACVTALAWNIDISMYPYHDLPQACVEFVREFDVTNNYKELEIKVKDW